MLRQKKLLWLMSAVCFAIVLASMLYNGPSERVKPILGQGGPVDEPKPAAGDVKKELKLAVSVPPKEFQLLSQLKDQFEVSHPGVLIRLENIPNETAYVKLKKMAQLGEAPDIMLLDNEWVGEFAALGYLLPVDPMMTADMQSQQMEQAIVQVKWNGYIWAVPKDLDAYVMVYNAKKLTEMGMDKPPSQAEELIALHKQVHKPEEGKYGVYFNMNNGRTFASFARMIGGAYAESAAVPVKLNEPNVLTAFESFLYTVTDGAKEEAKPLVKSFPSESVSWKPWDMLAQGKAAAYMTTFSDWRQNDSPSFAMSKLPLPGGADAWKGAWLTGSSFAIYARSALSKEAFELIRELVSPAAALRFWSAAGVLPAQSSVYTAGIKNDPAMKMIAGSIDMDASLPAFPQRMKQMSVLEEQLASLRNGEQSLKTFAERTEAAWKLLRPAAK